MNFRSIIINRKYIKNYILTIEFSQTVIADDITRCHINQGFNGKIKVEISQYNASLIGFKSLVVMKHGSEDKSPGNAYEFILLVADVEIRYFCVHSLFFLQPRLYTGCTVFIQVW